jgi:SAM-dependent methyltransferase
MPASEPLVDNRSYYDKFAETYEDRRHGGYHLLIDDLESGLVERVAAGKEVLEVGCGTGLILQRTARVAARAVGVDLSEGMLERARDRDLEVYHASATELPFEDSSFDVTYSFKVLAHVPDLRRALSEMGRVTRPGGRVFAELYNKHSLRYLIRRLRGGEKVAEGLDDNQVYFRFDTPDAMRASLPPDLELVAIHGVRLLITIPSMVEWPIVGTVLKRAERRLMSSSAARFGGFLILECKKR